MIRCLQMLRRNLTTYHNPTAAAMLSVSSLPHTHTHSSRNQHTVPVGERIGLAAA